MILRIRDANGNVQEILAIRGEDGTSVTVKSVSQSDEDGGGNIVTFSDGSSITIKNGRKGEKGDKGADGTMTFADLTDEQKASLKGDKGEDGEDYVLTDADKSDIAALVKATLTKETWTFTLEDGTTVTKAVYVG